MYDALLRAQPAQLIVDGEVAIETAEIAEDLGEPAPDDVMLESANGGDADFVPASIREGQTVAGEAAIRQ